MGEFVVPNAFFSNGQNGYQIPYPPREVGQGSKL